MGREEIFCIGPLPFQKIKVVSLICEFEKMQLFGDQFGLISRPADFYGIDTLRSAPAMVE